jgi:23S rRNA (uridine2552-2'-O)-methyltransferase
MAQYGKPDFWALKAQREGYPARSVYKLQELDEKFSLLVRQSTPLRVLDLGAAPGSWSLYVLRKLGGAVLLTAADLAPLSRQYDRGLFDGGNCCAIRGDITLPEIREAILDRGPFGLILSDAAPATTGNRSVDTLRSQALAEAALDYADTALDTGGGLVVKVFQGGDTGDLLHHIKTFFHTGKSFKPRACRSESFETYYIGLNKKPANSISV